MRKETILAFAMTALVVLLTCLTSYWLDWDVAATFLMMLIAPITLATIIAVFSRLRSESSLETLWISVAFICALLFGYLLGTNTSIGTDLKHGLFLGAFGSVFAVTVLLLDYDDLLHRYQRLDSALSFIKHIMWWRHFQGIRALARGDDALATKCASIVAYKIYRRFSKEFDTDTMICKQARHTLRRMRAWKPEQGPFLSLVEERLCILIGKSCDCSQEPASLG